MCSRPHTHVCSLHIHTRVASHTHVCVLAHTRRCVSECSSGASFNTSVQKRRNLRVDTSPTVLNHISLHHLRSSTCLNASQSLPRKKKYCIFSAPWARKHCARKQRNLRVDTSPTVLNRIKSTSFELLYLSEGLSKAAAKKKIWTVFLLARGRGSSAESHLPTKFLNCSPRAPDRISLHRFELLCPSEAFPKRAVANSFLVSTCIF